MTRGVYALASGGIAAQQRLQTVTQNLANVGTPGYKAERLIFQVRPLTDTVRGPLDKVLNRTAAQVDQVATIYDFSPGPVRASGNPLDVAISGNGFFAVSTPRGERYTRQGNFSVDREGYLVTQRGERVRGDKNADIRLGQGDVEIGEDGSVRVDHNPIGTIKIVDFGDKPQLTAEGGALFAPATGVAPAKIDQAKVRLQPGAIEGANVDAVSGLIELVEVSRGFESYVHAIQKLDEVAQRSITDVGRI